MKSQNKFGKQRLDDFYVDKTYTNLNHGSYGYCPKVVMQYKRQLEERMQFNTETWMRKDLQIMINQMRAYAAKKVSCPKQNIFLVQNATDAFNGLMKSLKWKASDVICLPNNAYACVRKTCQWLREYYGVEIFNINFTMDDLRTPQSIQLKIQDSINQFPKKIRIAVFDHISSMPSLVFPIHAIKLFLDEKKIDLFVDGAHAISQVDIDLMDLDCGAYFSNFHKWSYAPKNAAFLYISDKYINQVRPAITGNFKGEGIDRQYFWTGTRDCTSYLCIQKGIQYLESFGLNEVRNYNHNIVLAGARLMAEIWGTPLLSNDQRSIGFTACVLLPSNDQTLCNQISDQLWNKYNTFLVVGKFDGKMFTRLCGQIYNQIEDYRKTAQIFLQILNRKKGFKKQIKEKK